MFVGFQTISILLKRLNETHTRPHTLILKISCDIPPGPST